MKDVEGFTAVQQDLIKQYYLQKDDAFLAKLVGSTQEKVKQYREDNGLTRNAYTKKKLNIDQHESKEVDSKRRKKAKRSLSEDKDERSPESFS